MELHDHGLRKYGATDIIRSSMSCDWSGIAAELRYHPKGELPPFDVRQTEIGVATRSHPRARVNRRGNGVWQETPAMPGTIWTCPEGVREEEIVLSDWHECLHIYVPRARFVELSETRGGATVEARHIRYLAGLDDPLIRQIAWTLLREIQAPTAAGRVLAETLALSLTARLVQQCVAPSPAQNDALNVRTGLDDLRLNRVLDYMESHIEDDIGVDELAAVACLSTFHFIRMFHQRLGMPPSRYLSHRRMDHAQLLLAANNTTVGEIAFACRFSTQASFTRAFRRVTGLTPTAFRRSLR